MKKVILTAVAVFGFVFANAQDLKSKRGENFLPEAGDWAISFKADNLFHYVGNVFSSAGTNEIGSVSNPNETSTKTGSFTGKRFNTATQADRYTAGFQLMNGTKTDGGVETKSTKINVEAGLGKEWRRGKTRLQGFYGYDLVAGIDLVNSTKVTDPEGDVDPITGDFVSVTTDTKGGFGFNVGARGFLGAEYFIFPKMAIGAQYTYGVAIDIAGAGSTNGTKSKDKSTSIEVGNVGVASMSLTLHF